MSENNELEAVVLPMEDVFDRVPKTKFINNLDAITVELRNHPTQDELLNFIPDMVEATWAKGTYPTMANDKENRLRILHDVFIGKALPTVLETIGLTWSINGMSMQEVTHLIRHRTGSFSAECSGDKSWSGHDSLVPASIAQSTNFHARYQEITNLSKELYCDMIDSKEVSIMDARMILPRNLSTFYWMRMNLKDTINFIKQRRDEAIQPEADNIISVLMIRELLRVYPLLADVLFTDVKSWFYIKMARTGKATNLYYPSELNDEFEWNKFDFIYQNTRDKMNGTDEETKDYHHYNEVLGSIRNDIVDYKIEAYNEYSSILTPIKEIVG